MNTKTNSLFDKNVNIEPSGLIYNIKASAVEEFVETYLRNKGVDGVEAVVLKVKREGNNTPDAVLYLFMNSGSKLIKSSASNVPANLRNKLDRVSIELTNEFQNILLPLCGKKIDFGRRDNKLCYIRLDLFRAVGLMFSVDPSRHRVVISDIVKIPQGNDAIMSVVKQVYYNPNANTNNDARFERLINDIENNDRY